MRKVEEIKNKIYGSQFIRVYYLKKQKQKPFKD